MGGKKCHSRQRIPNWFVFFCPLQFLCLKNIRTFLTSCCVVFGMKKSDLFEAFDLFDVRDFGKVTPTSVIVFLSQHMILCFRVWCYAPTMVRLLCPALFCSPSFFQLPSYLVAAIWKSWSSTFSNCYNEISLSEHIIRFMCQLLQLSDDHDCATVCLISSACYSLFPWLRLCS